MILTNYCTRWLLDLKEIKTSKIVLFSAAAPTSTARTIEEDESLNYDPYERKNDASVRLDSFSDDALFRELLGSDCLTGKISVAACCWKTGLDPAKLVAFVARSSHLRLVTRVPAAGDDWGAV